MVNTRVKNPQHRQINRRLDRQKKALMRQNFRAQSSPLDPARELHIEVHKLKIDQLKKDRNKITNSKDT